VALLSVGFGGLTVWIRRLSASLLTSFPVGLFLLASTTGPRRTGHALVQLTFLSHFRTIHSTRSRQINSPVGLTIDLDTIHRPFY
jgi:hypothetical protein